MGGLIRTSTRLVLPDMGGPRELCYGVPNDVLAVVSGSRKQLEGANGKVSTLVRGNCVILQETLPAYPGRSLRHPGTEQNP